MIVLVPPVLVGSRICRVVSPVESIIEVEEWVGEWWEPSSVTLTAAGGAPLAPWPVLVSAGIPRDDHGDAVTRVPGAQLQAMLVLGNGDEQDTSIPAKFPSGRRSTREGRIRGDRVRGENEHRRGARDEDTRA